MDQIKIYYDLHSFVLEDLGQKEELKIMTLRTPAPFWNKRFYSSY